MSKNTAAAIFMKDHSPTSGQESAPSHPWSSAERLLAGLWSEVLGIDNIAVDANFFALGGSSLMAMQIVSRLRRTIQREVPVIALFDSPTIRELAVVIEALAEEEPLVDIAADLQEDELSRYSVQTTGGGTPE